MSLQSQLTRLAQNVGALTADTNAIFEALRAKGVNVPANAQLSDVADMIDEIEVPLPTVNIGGRAYPYVQIGNYLWLAENLDWKWDGLPIGQSTSNVQRANYYNDDESTYGWDGHKCGLLYNSASLSELASLLSGGWHIPSVSEWNDLIASTQDASNAALLVSNGSLSWAPSWTGSNMFKFNMIPSGQRFSSGTFSSSGVNAVLWASGGSAIYRDYISDTSTIDSSFIIRSVTGYGQFSIRLVKYAPGYVTIGGRQYKTVTIGNQEWLAENLDYKFAYSGSTLPIGSSDVPQTPSAWYYDNDEATYGIEGTYKGGLLYNWYAAKYLNDNKSTLLPSGWHVPTQDEWDVLGNEIGTTTAGTKLKALDGSIAAAWPSGWNGSDDYGFGGIPWGYRSSNKGFYDVGSSASYWTSTADGQQFAREAMLGNYAYLGGSVSAKWSAASLRLVKTVS